MQKLFLKNYAKNITKEDIYKFINKNNFSVTDEEVDIIYNHIKKYCNVIFDDPIKYIKMLKGKISDDNYYQMLMLQRLYLMPL